MVCHLFRMTIHVNVGEAKTRLSELLAAAARGEDVVVNKAGEPHARLVSISQSSAAEIARRSAKRKAAIGMFKHLVGDRNIDVLAIKATDRWDEPYERKFGSPD